MAHPSVITGLDIGTSHVRVVIAELDPEGEAPRVIGVGSVPSKGVRRGAITDPEAAVSAVTAAVTAAENMAGVAAGPVFANVNGSDLFCQDAQGVVAIGRSDGEVMEEDVDRALDSAQQRANLALNREILHILPKSFRLDDEKNIKDPVGMKGVRLEADAILIGGSTPHLRNLTRIIEQAKLSLAAFVADPLAGATAVLQSKHRELGSAMVNIGGATTTLAVFEESDLLHVKVIPVGSDHITNDIAIGLRTSIEVAEAVKLRYGTALPESIRKDEEIDLADFDPHEEGSVSARHVAEIVEARLSEIYRFVNDELKSIGRAELLPSGVLLTGGGAKLPGAVEKAKEALRLPAQVAYPRSLRGMADQIDDPAFATVVGLVLWAEKNALHSAGFGKSLGEWTKSFGPLAARVRGLLDRFMP